MALKESVNEDDGKIIAMSGGKGSYSYTYTVKDESAALGAETTYKSMTVTVFFLETRQTKKWWALTETAVTAFKAAYPKRVVNATCDSIITGAWSMEEETISIINTGYTIVEAPEEEAEV